MKSKSLGLWTLALGPLCILAACLTWGVWQEYRAWQHLRPQLASALVKLQEQRDIQRGLSMSEQDAEQRRSTSELNEIQWMADTLSEKATTFGLSGPQQAGRGGLPSPKGDWPESVLARRIVEDAEPILDQLEEWLLNNPESPIPLFTNSLETVLRVCFEYAIFKSDSTKAMRALSLISNLNIRQPGFSDIDNNRLYELIADSLGHDVWTAKQLEKISQEILHPLDIAAKLDESYRNRIERAMSQIVAYRSRYLFDGLEDPSEPQWSFLWDAIYVEKLLDIVARAKPIRRVDEVARIPSLLQSTRHDLRTHTLKSPLAVSTPFNNYIDPNPIVYVRVHEKFAWHLGKLESNRRIVALAVAIKRFEIQNDRWPTSLNELESAGFDSLILTGIGGNPYAFGFASNASGNEVLANLQSTEFWDQLPHPISPTYAPFGPGTEIPRRLSVSIR